MRGFDRMNVTVTDDAGSKVYVKVVFDTNNDGLHDLEFAGCGSVASVAIPNQEALWDGSAVVLVGDPLQATCSSPAVAGSITAELLNQVETRSLGLHERQRPANPSRSPLLDV